MRTFIAILLLIATGYLSYELMPTTYVPGYQIQIAPLPALLVALLPAILSLIGTGTSMAVAGAQGKKARKEANKYQSDLEKRRSDYDAWFNSEYNRDFLDTDIGRSSLNQIGAALKNTIQTTQNSAVRGGATPEAQVAAQGQAQNIYADAINRLAGMGTQYKQNLRNSYDYRIQNYLQPLDQLSMARMQNYANVGSQFNTAMGGFTTSMADIDWNTALGY